MAQIPRKERERKAREELIVDAAEHLLAEQGYFGFSLGKLAEAIEYAKGTIYQHFNSKEDIIMAIAARSMATRVEYFRRASGFVGKPRERMLAITLADQLFVKRFPGHFQVEHLIKSKSLWMKTSTERQQELSRPEHACGEIVNAIVDDAVAAGDLELHGRNAAEVSFGLWTLALGVHTLAASSGLPGSPYLPEVGIVNPYDSLRRNQQALMDGIGWQPLSSEWNYQASSKKIVAEVFSDEWEQAYGAEAFV